ncbi:MAG TPA: hypothetical protein VFY93_14860, partial [Planctomycetota bacterium]|nr:hypothetical protein [Planctomycetota bacterium]
MRAKLVLATLPLIFGPALAGDDGDEAVLAAIDKGREAVKAGRTQEAIEELQKAIGLIQAKATRGLATFLPTRDEKAWEMGEVETQQGNWGSGDQSFQWSQVNRRYTKKGAENGPEVNVMISNSPQFIQMHQATLQMIKDPAMLAAMNQGDSKISVIEEGGWLGMVTSQNGDCTILAVHKKVMVQVEVQRGDEKLAKEFWTAMDRE